MDVNHFTTSEAGLSNIKLDEGLRLTPYYCPAGKLTIGYGHVILPHEKFTKITAVIAHGLLVSDCLVAEKAIKRYVKKPLTQNQFDALVSFVMNVGVANFRTSTLLKKLNVGDYAGADNEFLRWNKVRNPKTKKYEVSNGLTKRRKRENLLF